MPTTQNPSRSNPKNPLETSLRQLGPGLGQTAAETVGAFFRCEVSAGLMEMSLPRFADREALYCTQKNLGEKFKMTCSVAVVRQEWNRLFTDGESNAIKNDALWELANCVCGSVIADTGFSDEFGYLTPCVPNGDVQRAPALPVTTTYRCFVLIKGTAVHFAFTVEESTEILSPA